MSPSQSHHEEEMQTETSRGSPKTVTTQIWHKKGSCPKGTIPIRRAKKKYPNYGRKRAVFSHHNAQANDSNGLHWLRHNYSVSVQTY